MSHHHHHDDGGCHSDDEESKPSGNLYSKIDLVNVQVLNSEHPAPRAIKPWNERMNESVCIASYLLVNLKTDLTNESDAINSHPSI